MTALARKETIQARMDSLWKTRNELDADLKRVAWGSVRQETLNELRMETLEEMDRLLSELERLGK